MTLEVLALENQRLRAELQSLQLTREAERQSLQDQIAQLEVIRRNLEHTLAIFRRALFGSRSEKVSAQELEARIAKAAETPVRMQLLDGQMQTARLWAYGLSWAEVVFDFRTDKSQAGPKDFLRGTAARYVQADGGSSYGPVLLALNLWHIACMAHIRRAIFEARDDAPLAVDLILAAIQRLYRIERRAKNSRPAGGRKPSVQNPFPHSPADEAWSPPALSALLLPGSRRQAIEAVPVHAPRRSHPGVRPRPPRCARPRPARTPTVSPDGYPIR